MKPQIIQSLTGKDEYVLLPVPVYLELQTVINSKLAEYTNSSVNLTDYITNPVVMARTQANMTQSELANRLKVSQAYISKLEKQSKVSAKMLAKVQKALNEHQ